MSAEEQGGSVHFRVRVVYQNDGEPVPNLAPTAVAIGPDGVEAAPVTFDEADTVGEYEGLVAFGAPGAWKVRFDVAEPEGTLTVDRTVVAPTTTVVPTTLAPTTVAPTTVAPATTVVTSTTVPTTEESDGSPGAPVVVAALAAAVVMGGVVATARRRRGRER